MGNFNYSEIYNDLIVRFNDSIGYAMDVMDMIDEYIESSTIYHHDCFSIIQELDVTDFEEAIENGHTTLGGFAEYYLKEHCMEEYYGQLVELLEKFNQYNESMERYKEVSTEIQDLQNEIDDLDSEDDDDIEQIESIQYDLEGLIDEKNEILAELNDLQDELNYEGILIENFND